MAEMVPPVLPAPGLWVALTGVAEILGGVGLLFPERGAFLRGAWPCSWLPSSRPTSTPRCTRSVWAATLEAPGYLWFRASLQVFFLGWLIVFCILPVKRRKA
jgi:hypothetical protein